MISMTVSGIACNPANCLIVTPAWTFSGSAFAGQNVLDATYLLQSITPVGAGGSVTVVASVEASAMALTQDIGGVDLNGSASGITEIVGGRVVETLTLTVGPSGKTAGDFLTQWLTPPPVACPPPLIGVPPECRQPVCTDCAPPCTVNCQPVIPPAAPPVPLPTMSEIGLIALAVAIGVAALLSLRIRSKR